MPVDSPRRNSMLGAVLRRWRAIGLAIGLFALALCSGPIVGEDNIGRFPPREKSTYWASDDAASEHVDGAVAPASLNDSVVEPLPSVAPPPLPDPLDADAAYGWPGAEFPENGHGPEPSVCGVLSEVLPGYTPHNDPDDPHRSIGLGEPLLGTSWLNRPHYTALLVGSMIADDLRGNAELHNDLFVGLHCGWDFDHYYGAECRLAGGSFDVYDSPTDSSAGLAMADAHLLHYPWGDALWRPYYSVGLGLAYCHVRDNGGHVHNATLVQFPLGIGLKYQWRRHCAMRFDIEHNINFGGGGLDAMDNVSLTCGLEYHYGGHPKSYYPWNPSVYVD